MTPRPRKERVDVLLVDRGLAPTRARAQALVMAGSVWSDGVRVEKPGAQLPVDAPIEVRGDDNPFVSRGGMKLAGALDAFAPLGLDVQGARAIDIGASTGGFTDCLLQRGATSVVAVDVGRGQLADKLRRDPRVDVRERTNARDLAPEDVGGVVDLVVVDASFIGIGKLMPAIARLVRTGGSLVALVKPQFEAGREAVSRGKGVIRDEAVRGEAIAAARAAIAAAGFDIRAEVDSAVAGPKGNVERLVWATRAARPGERSLAD